jgi:hypothetical protein
MLRQRRTRLRDVPALPLLYLLHAIFTLASLVLRLYEALTSSPSAPTRDSTPPKRVALVLSTTPHAPPCRRVNSSYGRSLRRKEALRRAAVGSVLRAVRWAAAEGVEVVSVYEPSGQSAGLLLLAIGSGGDRGSWLTNVQRHSRIGQIHVARTPAAFTTKPTCLGTFLATAADETLQ